MSAAGHQTIAEGVVKKVKVTASGFTATDREYDGTTDVSLNLTEGEGAEARSLITLTGVLDGDTVIVMDAVGNMDDKKVGTNKTVKIDPTKIVLGGDSVANYELAEEGNQETTTINITKAAAALSPADFLRSEQTIEYNPNNYNLTVDTTYFSNASINGLFEGDDLRLLSIGGIKIENPAGDPMRAGINYLTYTGIEYTGDDKENYDLKTSLSGMSREGGTIDVTAKPITTITGVSVSDKIYDAGTSATVTGTATSSDVYPVDASDVTFAVTGTFGDKKVGTNKTVTLNVTLSGNKARNYTVEGQTFTETATISKKKLTWDVSVNNKVYDGETEATVNKSSASMTGKCSGDDVTMQTGGLTGTFEDKEVGEGKKVTVTGVSFTGNDVGNYTWDTSITKTASITEDTSGE